MTTSKLVESERNNLTHHLKLTSIASTQPEIATSSDIHPILSTEVDISNGMSMFEIVGLPDTAMKESREWVHSAIKKE